MTTFAFTDTTDVKSKAVDALTYNENTRELVIDWNDKLFKYDGVDRTTFDAVRKGTYKNGYTDASVGRAANRLKRDFGPGEFLGKFGEVKFTPVSKATQVSAAKATIPVSPTTASASQTFSLTPSPSVNVGSETTYTVDFVPAGSDEPREYTPAGVTSVDEAVAALNEVAEMLGVELTVKGVYVDFE